MSIKYKSNFNFDNDKDFEESANIYEQLSSENRETAIKFAKFLIEAAIVLMTKIDIQSNALSATSRLTY